MYPAKGVGRSAELESAEEVRQGHFKPFGYFFDVDQRDVSHSALDAAIVCPVQTATLGSFFLIDPLFLAYAANCAAKPNADVHRHRL